MQIALNGKLCSAEDAVVSVYDHGFLYGMGLFETFRTYSGEPFLLTEHCNRLSEGCRELGIDYIPNREELRLLTRELLQANGLEDAYFRFSVSAGEEALGLPPSIYSRPTEILYIKPLPAFDEKLYRVGKALQLLKLRRNTPEGTQRLKSFHYMNPIGRKRELAGYPWSQGAEGLFCDKDGFVAEGIVSNVFWVRNGTVFTPAVETGILPGITRWWVLERCREEGIPCEEGCYPWSELLQADEVFLTNSIQELVPTTRLYDTDGSLTLPGGTGEPGPLTSKLMELYRKETDLTGGEGGCP